MPYQGFNYAAIQPTIYEPNVNEAFKSLLQGMEIGAKPGQLKRQAEKELHENIIKRAEAEHAPENERFKMLLNKAKGENAQEEALSNIAHTKAQTNSLNENAKWAGGQMPESVRIANSMAQPGSEKWKEIIAQTEGIPYEPPVTEQNSQQPGQQAKLTTVMTESLTPIRGGKNERTAVSKELTKQETIANGMIKTNASVQRIKEIITANPNLSGTFSAIMANPEKRNSIFSNLMAQAGNQKERAAVEKLIKETNDLVLGMQSMNPGIRSTDSLRELWTSTKPQFSNSDEANMYVLDRLNDDTIGGRVYLDTIHTARKKGMAINVDQEAFKNRAKELQQNSPTKGADKFGEMISKGAVKGIINGEEWDVEPQDIDAFIAAGGQING